MSVEPADRIDTSGSGGESAPEPSEKPSSETLVARFAAWLDETLARPEPPHGIAAELLAELADAGDPSAPEDDHPDAGDADPGDLYSLWSAVTTLTQEVKLQGRAFQRLTDEIAPLGATLEETRQGHRDALAEIRRQSELRVWRQTLDVLLDLRDRLERGDRTAADQLAEMPPEPPWAFRLFRRLRDAWKRPLAAAQALAQGYALSLERLDEELDRLGVRPLASLRRPFDPHTMTAVDVAETSPQSDGTVLEVYQRGYAWGDEILRPARVKVGRAARDTPAGSTGGDSIQEDRE